MDKVIHVYVPKGWSIPNDIDGTSTTLSANMEYKITLNTSDVIYGTIRDVEVTESTTYLHLATVLTPGGYDCIKSSDMIIDWGDVDEIIPQRARYVQAKRKYSELRKGPDTKLFTFEFDRGIATTKYRITVTNEEFIALAVRSKRTPGKSFTVYGSVEEYSDDSIIVSRYISKNGVRSVWKGYKVPIVDLMGIYRYELALDNRVIEEENAIQTEDETSAATDTVEEKDGIATTADEEQTYVGVTPYTPTGE